MDDIRIDIGVYTELTVDLSEFDFTGIDKVIMTCKNNEGDIVFEREFSESGSHNINITPEESRKIKPCAKYDFDIITEDGKRYKNGDNGRIILRLGCGQCNES